MFVKEVICSLNPAQINYRQFLLEVKSASSPSSSSSPAIVTLSSVVGDDMQADMREQESVSRGVSRGV